MNDFKGLENFLKKCENLENEQKQIILKEIIAENLYQETKENFENEKDSFGKPWKALSIATLKQRKYSKIFHNKKLFAHGVLSTSLNSGVIGNKAFVAVNAKQKNFAYGAAHQFGTKKIPARSFFPADKNKNVSPKLAKKIQDETKTDKSTWPLFGDAGTATALEYSDDSSDGLKFYLNTDGGV